MLDKNDVETIFS